MTEAARDVFGLVGTTLEGRFAVERVVAQGGFGVVYQGRHLTLRKQIAIKVLFIPADLGEAGRKVFLESFTLEAQTIADLDHPAIVRVLDFGVSQSADGKEMPWMAMEWIEGKSLEKVLAERQGAPMSPGDALQTLKPVFQALAFAHEQRIAHRDIKPSNMMILAHRSGSQVGLVGTKLFDFGIAKAMSPDDNAGSGATRTHALYAMYSLPYAAPEQKVGMKTGPWTDVHAMGLILTQMLTGHAPYPGDRIEIEQRIMASLRPSPSMFGVDVGPWEPVIARAVSLRTPDRFQDAGSFLAALEAAVPDARSVTYGASAAPPGALPISAHISGATPRSDSGASPAHSQTITGAPVSMPILVPASSSRGRLVVGAVSAGVALALLVGGVAWKTVLAPPDVPPAHAATMPPHAAVSPPRTPAAPVIPVAPPAAVAAPAPVVAPSVALPAAPAVLQPPAVPSPHDVSTAAQAPSARHHGSSHGSHHARRPD